MTTLIAQAINAVLAQSSSLTATNFQGVASHGADVGVSGFIYYTETEAFYDANEALINEMLQDLKDAAYGDDVSIFEMISGFGRGKDLEVVTAEFEYDEEYEEYSDDVEWSVEVVQATPDYDNCGMKAFAKDTQYKNLMAWFVLEEVARVISDKLENEEVEEVVEMGIDCEEFIEYNA